MLLFLKGEYLDLVRQGKKTTTIRPWKTCKLKPGRTVSFNGRLRVPLVKVAQVALHDIDDRAARADGFNSRREFLQAFRACYPGRDLSGMLVWVLTFTSPKQSPKNNPPRGQ